MDVTRITELSDLFEAKGLTKMEICDGETKVLFEKEPAQVVQQIEMPAAGSGFAGAGVSAGAAGHEGALGAQQVSNDVGANFTEVKSPMVGVFYGAPNPEDKPFVQVGSVVKKGDVLCIVEAMKLMNEITAEVDGEVAEVCAENGQVVEFSQTLFKIF